MKNKFIIIFFMFLINLSFSGLLKAEEFLFEVTDVEIIENGDIYKGNNRGKITTDSLIELTSDNFEYLKKINRLEANGNVQVIDIKNDLIINAEKIFYLKDKEIIYTVGKTLINVSNKYNIKGFNLTLLKNDMILLSKERASITDTDSNIYKLSNFQYLIDKEVLKGEKIEITTKLGQYDSDKYFFETGFFNLKEDKFLAKDINVKLHKKLFDDDENDPRINAVSGYGEEFVSTFNKGVFTSCKKTDKCPPWKIVANKVKHDKIKKQLVYTNAWLEIYNFPVVYFPKFFHPDPSVERQSGFLKPQFGSSEILGDSVYMPYFYVISDTKDITIKPRLFNDDTLVLQNEYRQKTKKSLTVVDFSMTKNHDYSVNQKGTRTHFFANSKIDLDLNKYINSGLEINLEKISNDNYLKIFKLEGPLLLKDNSSLESQIEINLEHENFDFTTSVEMYETLNGSNSDRYQYVLPSYSFSKNFDFENINGSFNFGSSGNNTLSNTNVITSRISNNFNYSSLDFFFDNGIKTNFNIFTKNINSIGKNHATYKNSPQSELMSSYSYDTSLTLRKINQDSINTLMPRLSFRVSPHEMKNHSATGRRINIDNIFSSNRLGLGDSFETGESVTIGVDFFKEKKSTKKDNISKNEIIEIEKYLDFKLATVFRLNEEKNIPIKSTLDKKNSNLFGKLNFKPTETISLDYDFSLTNDLSAFEYNSMTTKLDFENFSTQFDYIEERGVIGKTNLIENTTTYNFNNKNSIIFGTRRNRLLNLTEYYDLIYEYKNDCLIASIKYKKDYYRNEEIKPVEELFFSITIVPFYTYSPEQMILNKDRID